jgi:hypothetical protein
MTMNGLDLALLIIDEIRLLTIGNLTLTVHHARIDMC